MKVWVIEKDQKIIGFVSICPSRDKDTDPSQVAEISAIYLLPDFWQQGLGWQLSQVAFNAIQEMNYKKVIIWVFESNRQARKFYEALGFNASGDIKREYFGGESLVVMRYKKVIT